MGFVRIGQVVMVQDVGFCIECVCCGQWFQCIWIVQEKFIVGFVFFFQGCWQISFRWLLLLVVMWKCQVDLLLLLIRLLFFLELLQIFGLRCLSILVVGLCSFQWKLVVGLFGRVSISFWFCVSFSGEQLLVLFRVIIGFCCLVQLVRIMMDNGSSRWEGEKDMQCFLV